MLTNNLTSEQITLLFFFSPMRELFACETLDFLTTYSILLRLFLYACFYASLSLFFYLLPTSIRPYARNSASPCCVSHSQHRELCDLLCLFSLFLSTRERRKVYPALQNRLQPAITIVNLSLCCSVNESLNEQLTHCLNILFHLTVPIQEVHSLYQLELTWTPSVFLVLQ